MASGLRKKSSRISAQGKGHAHSIERSVAPLHAGSIDPSSKFEGAHSNIHDNQIEPLTPTPQAAPKAKRARSGQKAGPALIGIDEAIRSSASTRAKRKIGSRAESTILAAAVRIRHRPSRQASNMDIDTGVNELPAKSSLFNPIQSVASVQEPSHDSVPPTRLIIRIPPRSKQALVIPMATVPEHQSSRTEEVMSTAAVPRERHLNRHISNMDAGLHPVTEMQFEESSSSPTSSVPVVQGLPQIAPVAPSATPSSTSQDIILLGATREEQSEVVAPPFSEVAPQRFEVSQHLRASTVDSTPTAPRLTIRIPPSSRQAEISAMAPTEGSEAVSELPSARTQQAGRKALFPVTQSSGKRTSSRPKGLSTLVAITRVVRSSARIRAQRNIGSRAEGVTATAAVRMDSERCPPHRGSNVVTDLDAVTEKQPERLSSPPSLSLSLSTDIPSVSIVQQFPDVQTVPVASSAADAVRDEQSEAVVPSLLGVVPVISESGDSQHCQEEPSRGSNTSQNASQGIEHELVETTALVAPVHEPRKRRSVGAMTRPPSVEHSSVNNNIIFNEFPNKRPKLATSIPVNTRNEALPSRAARKRFRDARQGYANRPDKVSHNNGGLYAGYSFTFTASAHPTDSMLSESHITQRTPQSPEGQSRLQSSDFSQILSIAQTSDDSAFFDMGSHSEDSRQDTLMGDFDVTDAQTAPFRQEINSAVILGSDSPTRTCHLSHEAKEVLTLDSAEICDDISITPLRSIESHSVPFSNNLDTAVPLVSAISRASGLIPPGAQPRDIQSKTDDPLQDTLSAGTIDNCPSPLTFSSVLNTPDSIVTTSSPARSSSNSVSQSTIPKMAETYGGSATSSQLGAGDDLRAVSDSPPVGGSLLAPPPPPAYSSSNGFGETSAADVDRLGLGVLRTPYVEVSSHMWKKRASLPSFGDSSSSYVGNGNLYNSDYDSWRRRRVDISSGKKRVEDVTFPPVSVIPYAESSSSPIDRNSERHPMLFSTSWLSTAPLTHEAPKAPGTPISHSTSSSTHALDTNTLSSSAEAPPTTLPHLGHPTTVRQSGLSIAPHLAPLSIAGPVSPPLNVPQAVTSSGVSQQSINGAFDLSQAFVIGSPIVSTVTGDAELMEDIIVNDLAGLSSKSQSDLSVENEGRTESTGEQLQGSHSLSGSGKDVPVTDASRIFSVDDIYQRLVDDPRGVCDNAAAAAIIALVTDVKVNLDNIAMETAKVTQIATTSQKNNDFPVVDLSRKSHDPQPRDSQSKTLHSSLHIFVKSLLGGSAHELQVPTSQQLLQFKHQHGGPSLDNLLLDLAGDGVRTPWNKAVAGLIAERYITEGHGGDNKKIQEAFLIYLQRLQNVYKAQNEVGPAVIARRDMVNDRASDGRKYCKRNRRFGSLDPYIRVPGVKQLRENLRLVPSSTMSGDEYEADSKKRFITSRPVWRSKEARDFYEICDALSLAARFTPNDRPTSGRFPAPRILSDRLDQTSTTPCGLPENFYDDEYLASLGSEKREKLNIQPKISLKVPVRLLRIAERYRDCITRDITPLPWNHPRLDKYKEDGSSLL